jgi:16S rRNA (cytosine967-C5)-methyltransferase
VDVLLQRDSGHHFTENLLDRRLAGVQMQTPDRALCRELVSGCVRWQLTLDELIDSRTDGRRQPNAVRVLLRLGLYQLLFLSRIPPHAAVHETVALAAAVGCTRQKGFINAILRHYGREAEATRARLEDWRETDPSLGYSHPDWLVQRWIQTLGPAATRHLLDWNNQPPPTYARLNTLKTDAASLTRRWSDQEGVDFEQVSFDWVPDGLFYRLKSNPPFPEMESFRDGWFYLQDPSTALACSLLDPRPGEEILDYCAAPGGKTTLMAQMADDRAGIVAQDHHHRRLRLIRENCMRLGVTGITDLVTAVERDEKLAGRRFDKILLDVPCSNTGVLRRRIDLRWRLAEDEFGRLAEAQRLLLEEAHQWLKPGGRLVYSTCSIDPDENESITGGVGASRLLTPFNDGCDGAYACVIDAPA